MRTVSAEWAGRRSNPRLRFFRPPLDRLSYRPVVEQDVDATRPTKKARRRVDAGPCGSSERVGHASPASLIAQRGISRPFAFGGSLKQPRKRQTGGFRRERDGYEIKPEHGWQSSCLNIPDRSFEVSLNTIDVGIWRKFAHKFWKSQISHRTWGISQHAALDAI